MSCLQLNSFKNFLKQLDNFNYLISEMQSLFLLDQTQKHLIFCCSTMVAFLVVSELENLPLVLLIMVLKAIMYCQ